MTLKGGYAVQPESSPPNNGVSTNKIATGGIIQKLRALMRGKATSLAPIMIGNIKLPNPPMITATATATMMIPCKLIIVL